MATTNGTDILDEIGSKAPDGTVLPPRGLRDIIEKTAGYVARNGASFEEKIRANQGNNPRMSFLNSDDAYLPYYQWRISEIRAGRGTSVSAGREGEQQTGAGFKGREARKGPEKPEEFEFSARMPNISAQDLEVVKLTALFAAKNGRSWVTALSQREAGNYQFDFLRPQHSLYSFFDRLRDQYTALLTGDSTDNGRPQKRRVTELEANVNNRFRVLDKAKKRAEWVKYQEAQKVAKEEQEEKEKTAYAQIDWHDFQVVEVVLFDETDDQTELPRPMTLNDLQSASLEQKAAMSVDPSRRIEEAMPTFDDYPQFYGHQAPTPQAQPVQMPPPPQAYTPTQPQPQQAYPFPQQQQAQSQDDEATRVAALQADRARARAAQEAAKSAAPLKIRKDYVPAAQARKQAPNTSICPNCKQAIPNDEMANHLRIEMLDPQWRDQNRIAQQRSSTTNLSTQDVANNLKRLASQRTDVFDPVTGEMVVSQEEIERRKRIELGAYDGVSGMPNPAALAAAQSQQQQHGPQQGGDGKPKDVQEQIRLIHERARNG